MTGRLKNLIMNNLGLKIFSIVFASFLWFMIVGQEKMEVGFTIPVELTNIPETVVIEGRTLEFIHVRLRGSRNTIQEISPSQVQASLDLENLKPGDNFMPITNRNISLLKGVELINISPPYIHIKAAARRLVPIKSDVVGKPADGFEVVKILSIPSNIYIIGSPNKVNNINEIKTYPINITDETSTFRVRADLISPAEDIRLLEMKPTEVTVVIEEKTLEKTFKGIAVEGVEETKARFKPKRVQVTLKGPYHLIKELEEETLKARVEIGAAQGKVFSRIVKISVPEGVEIVEIIPETVEVNLP